MTVESRCIPTNLSTFSLGGFGHFYSPKVLGTGQGGKVED